MNTLIVHFLTHAFWLTTQLLILGQSELLGRSGDLCFLLSCSQLSGTKITIPNQFQLFIFKYKHIQSKSTDSPEIIVRLEMIAFHEKN